MSNHQTANQKKYDSESIRIFDISAILDKKWLFRKIKFTHDVRKNRGITI